MKLLKQRYGKGRGRCAAQPALGVHACTGLCSEA